MNVQFDTSALTKVEAQGIIVLLTTLFPISSSQPVRSSPAVPSAAQPDPTPAPTPSTGPVLVPPAVQSSSDQPTATRHRRTKAEMAAAKDAPADPTQGSAVEAAAASGTTGPATASSATAPAGEAKPISADDLRSLLNSYIKKHGMDEAIAQLKRFGCNRVTEALALDPVKLNELAAALNG